MFGASDVALRAFSTLCGASVIVLGFLLSRKLFGKKAGYLALPLLTLSPMLLRYGIEMRMYTLVVTIVLAQVLALLRAREKSSRARWITYGILLALGAWTQYFAVFASIAQLIWLFAISRNGKIFSRKSWRKFFVNTDKKSNNLREIIFAEGGNLAQSLLVAFIIFLPWIPFVLIQFLTVNASGFWIPPVNFATLADLISGVFFFQTSGNLTGWGAAILIVILAMIIWKFTKIFRENREKKFRENLLLVGALVMIPPLILFAISLPPMRSYFIDRYVLASAVLVSVMIAVIVAFGRKFFAGIILYILILVSFIAGFFALAYYGNYNRYSGEVSTARDLMSQIREKSSNAQTPIIADSAWSFYDADVYATSQDPVFFLRSQVDNYYYGSEKMLANAPEEIGNLREFFAKNQTEYLWYISSTGNAGNPPAELGNFAKNLTKIREINATAPNGWKGSTQAILYRINR
jgi:uncharacterized membrane protein